jgi:hypothetical protein
VVADAGQTAEEAALWHIARHWRDGRALPSPSPDWPRLVQLAIANKAHALLSQYLADHSLLSQLPAETAELLQSHVERFRQQATLLSNALRQYLVQAARQKQEVVVLKGLWVAIRLYGRAELRPGGDIDLLLRRRDVAASIRLIEEHLGCGRYWRPLLDDAYYWRHHLHQQRCSRDLALWFEPHWAFDHPYSALTINYEAVMDRTTPGELSGQPVRELEPGDLLLSLAIHLVKHAVYLPAALERADLPRLVLADAMLMNYVDIAELLKQYGSSLDWPAIVARAREWGAADILVATVRACHRLLAAPAPAELLNGPFSSAVGPVSARVMQAMADHKLAAHQGVKDPDRLWSFLVGYKAGLVFRPIRLLDLVRYLFPGADYLARRYGSATWSVVVAHLGRALGQHGRIAADTLYYTWRRNRRLRQLERRQPDYFASPAEVKGH